MSDANKAEPRTTAQRYWQLAVLTLAGGAIYPLVYLRQNFEVPILDSFGISITQLGRCYAMLGVIFMISYLPSGWLADRFSPRWLLAFSLTATGVLGIWFSTMPSYDSLLLIFGGWGITTGLTFWAALIKGVAIIGRADEQGRFFGLLDGGRGLFEAIVATIAVALFAYLLNTKGVATNVALLSVIYLYVGLLLVLAPVVLLSIHDGDRNDRAVAEKTTKSSVFADLKLILSKPEIWLAAFCINAGYQLFWATYSFSGYLEGVYGLSVVTVGIITVAKLWMRPIGAIAAGFLGDKLQLEKFLATLMLAGTLSLALLTIMPVQVSTTSLLAVVMLIGFLTYAIRGIFWATLESCDIANRTKGLAIGVMSFIGYSPDFYLPLLNGQLLQRYPGKTGYSIYFGVIIVFGLLGTLAAWRLHVIAARRRN